MADPAYTLAFEASPAASDIQALERGLIDHSLRFTTARSFDPIAVFLRDAHGAVVGGAVARINWTWLFVSLLWLSDSLRGAGWGARLMDAIEEEGRRRGCAHAHLDTFSFQAREFYEARGYEVFATLDDYPPSHRRFFLRKSPL